MNICIMTSVYALNETDRHASFLVEMVKHLRARGHQVSIFAPAYKGLKSHSIDAVPVFRFRYFFSRWEDLTHGEGAPNRVQNPFYFALSFIYLVSGALHAMWYCRQHQFDVIQVHWPFPHGVWGYLAGLSSGTPMTLHFHGAEVLLAKKVFFVQYFLRHALTHAISIFANSGFTAREVNLYSARPVHVVPYGSTLELGSEDKPASQSMKQILFVGRLIERKGIEYLLQAVSLLPADLQWHLNIVGTGDAAETLRAITRRLGLETSVEFHGFVPNEALIHHYQQADLFVLPAITDHKGDTEGLGVVMIEALSYHTPVVASDVGGISDVIINGQTGILVPEKNPDKLAHAIVEMLRHPEKARRLAQNGYQHVHTYFDWDRIVNELLEITTQALRHQTN